VTAAASARRFLIVRLGSLGDVVHAIPAAEALRRHAPDVRIDWLVDPRYVELLRMAPCVDRAIPADPRGGLMALARVVLDLRRQQYEAAIDLQGLYKSAILARLSGADTTLGFSRAHLREPGAAFFYTRTADPGGVPHVVHKNLALLSVLGVPEAPAAFRLEVPGTRVAEAAVATFGADGFALLNPGAAWPNKRWGAARFGALAAAVRRDVGVRSLVLWGPGEEPLARAVVEASAGAAEMSPPTTITELCSIARHARIVVSGDTGPLHLAAAVGAPIVALFGPTLAERNGPWAPSDIVVARTSACECLYQRQCRRSDANGPGPCIEDIGVDEVMQAVRRRLAHG
jgi:lipopolysaccharide heptosyltransferase I